MVYKGMVMETTDNYIIVLTEDANYVKLKSKGSITIGKKIIFIEEDIIKERNRSMKPLIAIAAAIILILTTVIGQFDFDYLGNFKAYAIVSLDINPSLEFQIDEKEIVRKVNSLNRDGKELLNNNMVGMRIEDAVALSIKTALNKQYLSDEENVVLISNVIMDNAVYEPDMIEDKIFQRIEEDEKLKNIDVIYLDSNKENLKKARENNLSIGKYEVYRMASDENPNVKIKDIKEKKVSDIVRENKMLTESKKVKGIKKERNIKDIKDSTENKEHSENYKNHSEEVEKQNKHDKNVNSGKGVKNKEVKQVNKKNKDSKENMNTNSKNNIKKNESYSSKKNIKHNEEVKEKKQDSREKEAKKENREKEKNKRSKDSKKYTKNEKSKKTNKKKKDK